MRASIPIVSWLSLLVVTISGTAESGSPLLHVTPVSAQEHTGSYRSPPMLLLGVDVPSPDASYQLLTHLPDRGRAVYGLGLTHSLGATTRIAVNALAGPAVSSLPDRTGGAMLIATTSLAHQGAGSGGTFTPNRQVLPDGTALATSPTITPAVQFTLRIGVSD